MLAGEHEQAAPNPEQSTSKDKPQKQALFHDDALPSFFRRLAWSPDGDTFSTLRNVPWTEQGCPATLHVTSG